MPSACLQLVLQIADRLLVQGGLLPGQAAKGLHLGLVGQIGDDALVGLQAAQDVRLHQRPQRLIRRHRPPRSSFLTKFANALALPSRPGFRKSNSDHRSESRFSTGVPVRAMRPAACSSLTARAWRVPAFLMAWASSRMTRFQLALAQPFLRDQHAVGGDDQVAVLRRPRRRAPSCPAGVSEGGRSQRSATARTASISAFQLAINEPARPAGLGRPPSVADRFRARCRLMPSSRAITWTVLPRPMSSARQAPRPSWVRSAASPGRCADRAAVRPAGRAGSAVAAASGDSQPIQRRFELRAGRQARPLARRLRQASPPRRAPSEAPASKRMPFEEGQAVLVHACVRPFCQCSSASASFSRSTSTHLPLSRTRPSDRCQQFLDLGLGSAVSPSSADADREIEQAIRLLKVRARAGRRSAH